MNTKYLLGAALLVFGCMLVAGSALAQQPAGDVEAFADDSLFVANPAEIINIRRKLQDQSAAGRAPIEGGYHEDIPADIMDLDYTFDLSMEPGEAAPRIYIARYQSSAIQFIDAYGNHWPLRKVSSFMGDLIQIEKAVDDNYVAPGGEGQDGEAGGGYDLSDPQSGSFTVTSNRHGAVGNITVYLVGMAQPVSLILVTKPAMFHRSATIRIGTTGPNSEYSMLFERGSVAAGAAANVDLTNALHGVTPHESERLEVEGASGKAWVKGDYVYLQTDLAIFSPRVLESTHSAGRYKAYKLPRTTRVMGTNTAGQTVSVRLKRTAHSALGMKK